MRVDSQERWKYEFHMQLGSNAWMDFSKQVKLQCYLRMNTDDIAPRDRASSKWCHKIETFLVVAVLSSLMKNFRLQCFFCFALKILFSGICKHWTRYLLKRTRQSFFQYQWIWDSRNHHKTFKLKVSLYHSNKLSNMIAISWISEPIDQLGMIWSRTKQILIVRFDTKFVL